MTHMPGRSDARPVLATDLDGTLIPLAGSETNESDLRILASQLEHGEVTLVFVTGRHFASVMRAIQQAQLPTPEWMICDVGTSIYHQQGSGQFRPVEAYQQHLEQTVALMPVVALQKRLESVEGLRVQEPEKQGRFKLSYYADAAQLDELAARIQHELDQTDAPYWIIRSVDPFNGDGLIDLLPANVSKAYALKWWVQHLQMNPDEIVFAGDSGNDLAALTAGYRAIIVGNADRQLAQQVYYRHRDSGWSNRLYLAQSEATSGLLDGCRWFELIEPAEVPNARLGATPISYNQTHFSVWAPERARVEVEVIDGETTTRHALKPQNDGYFDGRVPNATPGRQYCFRLDDKHLRPDPASRFQPEGVHRHSQIVDPDAFPWTDQDWRGVTKRELIVYELHIGTFTEEGTFQAAQQRLLELVDLGVTTVEIMPIAQSPGRWNWGYDGVDLFAVRNTYGEPNDFKAFVDACHAVGISVILDVVYNHLGPEGNYLGDFGPYFSRKHHTPWGEAFNYDEEHASHVRQFVVDNAIYWLDEYHLDGLRLDAVRLMMDDSQPTILDEIRQAVSAYSATVDRTLHLIAESNVYDQSLLESKNGQVAYDGIWCDCLMHSIYSHVLPDLQLTPRSYRGSSDLDESLRHGYVFAGREDRRASTKRSEASGQAHIPSLVTALQTHDAVGNHPHGKRIHQLTSKPFQKAAAALTLLYPSIPLIFMGEEVACDAPFPFFVDFEDERLREAVDTGRAREYPQHTWQNAPLPSDAEAFIRAKCHDLRHHDANMLAWYRDLISFRRKGVAEGWLSADRMTSACDASHHIFSMRYQGESQRAVLVQARLTPAECESNPIRLGLDGTLLFSSQHDVEYESGDLLLQPNHAIISLIG